MNIEFQNVVVQILKSFTCVYYKQRMSSRVQLIVYHNSCYTSFFWMKNGFHLDNDCHDIFGQMWQINLIVNIIYVSTSLLEPHPKWMTCLCFSYIHFET
jgi:hypothetical protein